MTSMQQIHYPSTHGFKGGKVELGVQPPPGRLGNTIQAN
jgi:hypothetical protein